MLINSAKIIWVISKLRTMLNKKLTRCKLLTYNGLYIKIIYENNAKTDLYILFILFS